MDTQYRYAVYHSEDDDKEEPLLEFNTKNLDNWVKRIDQHLSGILWEINCDVTDVLVYDTKTKKEYTIAQVNVLNEVK